jgi:uncharacterized membrane protein YphA (DoxX/SURF4 family)
MHKELKAMNRMNQHPSLATRALNILLWTAQILCGVLFSVSGFGKVLAMDSAVWHHLLTQVVWFSAVPQALFVFIGICEGLGGIGLIVPAMTRVAPKLTPLAAAGIAIIMALAAVFHIVRGESHFFLPLNLLLGGVAAFIAFGRLAVPIAPAPMGRFRMVTGMAVSAALVLAGCIPVLYQTAHIH